MKNFRNKRKNIFFFVEYIQNYASIIISISLLIESDPFKDYSRVGQLINLYIKLNLQATHKINRVEIF